MCIWFTTSKVTASYQYMYSSCYWEIHLLRFISCYRIFIYNKEVILLGLICPLLQHFAYFTNNHHKNLTTTQILNQLLL